MSPRSLGAISPMSARGLHLAHDHQHRQPYVRSLSSQGLGSTSDGQLSKWGSSSREPQQAVNKEEPDFSWVQKPYWAVDKAEPNFPWVQSLVNETPHEVKEGAVYDGDGPNLKNELEQMDEAIFCIEQMQLEGLVDQPNSIGRQ
ncbi:hypothetical protein Tco_0357657 [Tanacetum coccineum]